MHYLRSEARRYNVILVDVRLARTVNTALSNRIEIAARLRRIHDHNPCSVIEVYLCHTQRHRMVSCAGSFNVPLKDTTC